MVQVMASAIRLVVSVVMLGRVREGVDTQGRKVGLMVETLVMEGAAVLEAAAAEASLLAVGVMPQQPIRMEYTGYVNKIIYVDH